MPATVHVVSSLDAAVAQGADALVLVGPSLGERPAGLPPALATATAAAVSLDAALRKQVGLVAAEGAPGRRLVLAPTGPLDRDIDDVRRVGEAAAKGAARAKEAGARRVVVQLVGVSAHGPRYAEAHAVAALSALAALSAPLEAREARGGTAEPVEAVYLVQEHAEGQQARVRALDAALRLTRDLAGTEPERMRPERFADALVAAFAGTSVQVEVIEDVDLLARHYPLLMAVARASLTVARHRPRVVRLSWQGAGPVGRTLYLAGKGVTYDTGGADLKVGGAMAGMSRDKGGAAAVAGFVAAAAALAPSGLRVVAELGLVRNSIGADAFVTDEIITSHAGRRVRIGNTDAEGRLVLADLLSHLRSDAVKQPASAQPELLSVATLTGHAHIAVGPYTLAVANGPSRRAGADAQLALAGELWGDPVEPSRLRREDFEMVAPRTQASDVLSCNNAPSSRTARGHQFPAAFLAIASGLDAHEAHGEHPLPFLHLDIGGSGCAGGDWQFGQPTAAPVRALVGRYLLR